MANDSIRDRKPALIGQSAKIEDSFFYSGCSIEGTVKHSILFPGVSVEKGAVVKDSILFFDSRVRANARVTRTIADSACTISANADIGDPGHTLTVIGMDTVVPENIRIAGGVRVHPKLKAGVFTKSRYAAGEVVQ